MPQPRSTLATISLRNFAPPLESDRDVFWPLLYFAVLWTTGTSWTGSLLASDMGIKQGDYKLKYVNYADDVALFYESHEKLWDILLQIETEASEFDLCISWTTTKTQNLGLVHTKVPISISSRNVEQVNSFGYLTSNMHSMANSWDGSLCFIIIASSTMDQLDRIWRQRNLSLKTKFQMYTSLAIPVLYGSETRATTSQDWQKIDAFHTKVQCQILNVKWLNFIHNDEIYSGSAQKTMHPQIRHWHLGLLGQETQLPVFN